IARSNGWNLTTYPEITERIDYVNNLTEQAWQMYQHQQAKVEELQKRVDYLEKAEFKLAQVKAILQNNPKLLESILIKKIEQTLKGEGQ
ncbi:hypothetical protein HN279_20270, partial [Acinetobacter baumannii]|nr:hypothetical protein [Acinetobacter baumannii]